MSSFIEAADGAVAGSVLSVNAGSSSIKFSLYRVPSSEAKDPGEGLVSLLSGKVDRIGTVGASLSFHDRGRQELGTHPMEAGDHGSAAALLIDWLEERLGSDSLKAVGHRVVHGMERVEPERITPGLLRELHRLGPYDPDHLPRELELIEAFRVRHPTVPQVACFDTAFHRTLPRVASILPLPRRYGAKGVRRYGFHGLSYAYLMGELVHLAGEKVARGRVILAHLGSGASLAAVRDLKSVDTSMGFTPTGGIPMASRPGDLDPGVAWYLMEKEGLSPRALSDLINHESGLLGVSETSSDMRDLLDRQHRDERAAEAVALFCYQTRKWIGAFAAALGGLDTLVFSGGIGERSPEIRSRIIDGLDFLGIHLDAQRNALDAPVISAEGGTVTVRVIPTDEERMIAESTLRLLRNQEEDSHE